LQGVQQLALGSVETGELVGAADLDGGPVAVHVDVHVAVEVGDVQQLLEVVGGDVALLLEAAQTLLGGLAGVRLGLAGSARRRRVRRGRVVGGGLGRGGRVG